MGEDEIDGYIAMLKADLDVVAARAKAAFKRAVDQVRAGR